LGHPGLLATGAWSMAADGRTRTNVYETKNETALRSSCGDELAVISGATARPPSSSRAASSWLIEQRSSPSARLMEAPVLDEECSLVTRSWSLSHRRLADRARRAIGQAIHVLQARETGDEKAYCSMTGICQAVSLSKKSPPVICLIVNW
jgi:hypothetical protein